MPLKIIVSNDGSSTLYNEELRETYHSLHGAIIESEHVYINAGLNETIKKAKSISILEIGLGTGLNVLLTLKAILDKEVKIDYRALEPFPIPSDIVSQLNYPTLITEHDYSEKFKLIHICEWEKTIDLASNMTFTKYRTSLENYKDSFLADLVYFDAFAPSKQPEIWSSENLQKIKDLMKADGIFVTYCANGAFKRNMKSLNFHVETLKGPPGKMEMTRAVKQNNF